MIKPLLTIVFAVAVGLGAAKALGLNGNAPTTEAPLPVSLFLLAFCCGLPPVLLPLIPSVAFLAWQPSMLRPTEDLKVVFPGRTWILFFCTGLLSLVGFVGGWRFGIQFQGRDFVWTCAAISFGLGTATFVLCAIAQVSENLFVNLLAHGILFYWASSYAFPYLGERL